MKKKTLKTDEFKIDFVPTEDGKFGYIRFENYRGEFVGSIYRDEKQKLKKLKEIINEVIK